MGSAWCWVVVQSLLNNPPAAHRSGTRVTTKIQAMQWAESRTALCRSLTHVGEGCQRQVTEREGKWELPEPHSCSLEITSPVNKEPRAPR